jgi:hypothetical protein
MNENNEIWKLIKVLSESEVKYVICGGVACFLHGVERITVDLDVSISLEDSNIEKIIGISKKLNLKPRNPEPIENFLDTEKRRQWIEKKGALVYTLVSDKDYAQLDIFLKYPKTFEELYANSDKMLLNGLEVNVSSKEDLIFAKEAVTPIRYKDETDIRELKILINKNG